MTGTEDPTENETSGQLAGVDLAMGADVTGGGAVVGAVGAEVTGGGVARERMMSPANQSLKHLLPD